MFSSKTLQVFLGIAAFAAISSRTPVLASSISRRMSKRSKQSKQSKQQNSPSAVPLPAPTVPVPATDDDPPATDDDPPATDDDTAVATFTLTTIRDIFTGDTILYGETSANERSIVGLILSPDIVEADDNLTVIGTTDYACTVTRSVPVLVVLCDVVACATPGDCIFVKARGEVNLSSCPFPQSGIVFGGTGIFSGATGSFSSTSDCEVNPGSITDTTELFLDASYEDVPVPV